MQLNLEAEGSGGSRGGSLRDRGSRGGGREVEGKLAERRELEGREAGLGGGGGFRAEEGREVEVLSSPSLSIGPTGHKNNLRM